MDSRALTFLTSRNRVPINATGAHHANMSIDLNGEADGQVFQLSMDNIMSMTVGGLPAGPFSVDGSGAMDMSLLWTGAGAQDLNVALGMDWIMDVSAPADGSCPTGAVTMEMNATDTNPFTFVGSYDGTASMGWTLYEAGVLVDSGSELMDCTVPAL